MSKQIFDLDSIKVNYWVFSILYVLADNDLVATLMSPTEVGVIEKALQLEATVNNNMLNVLVEHHVFQRSNDKISFTDAMKIKINDMGVEAFVTDMQLSFGKASSFVTMMKQKSWQHGWFYQDKKLLLSQGVASEVVVTDLFSADKNVFQKLNQPNCRLMDIGAGTAKISLKFCEIYPSMTVIALEPADAPYAIAKENIEASTYRGRVELRKQFIQDISDDGIFDAVWFPQGFLTNENDFVLGLKKIYQALKPGGLLLLATCDYDNNVPPLTKFIYSCYCADRPSKLLIHQLEKTGFIDVSSLPSKECIVPMIAYKKRL